MLLGGHTSPQKGRGLGAALCQHLGVLWLYPLLITRPEVPDSMLLLALGVKDLERKPCTLWVVVYMPQIYVVFYSSLS